jgi:serine/threonine-protein kinase
MEPLAVDYPYCIAVTPDGVLYVSQRLRNRVVRLDPDGTVTQIAGTGKSGVRGDGGSAVDAELDNPCGIALDADGSVFIADSFNNRVRRVDPEGKIITVAGAGHPGPRIGPGPRSAVSLALTRPHGVAVDAGGRLYIANTESHQVILVDPDGRAVPLAGVGLPGMTGDGGAGPLAQLRRPHDVAVAPDGTTVYVADTDNRRLRAVAPDGTIFTVAGVFYGGASGDAVPAQAADIGRPLALALAPSGELVVSDPDGRKVLIVTGGVVVQALGDEALPGRVVRPLGVAAGPDSLIYVADTARHLVHRLPRPAAPAGHA